MVLIIDSTKMKNISGILINTLPNKAEIKSYFRKRLIEEKYVERLSFLDRKVIYDCHIWIKGYAMGVSENFSKEAVKDEDLKEFYLDKVFNYVKSRL